MDQLPVALPSGFTDGSVWKRFYSEEAQLP
jgi:hypothetical protein